MQHSSRFLQAMVLASFLVLCQCSGPSGSTSTSSISCSELRQDALHQLSFGINDTAGTLQWITATYHLDSQAVARDSYSDGQTSLAWSTGGTHYLARFRQDRLTSVEVRWQSLRPTVGDALRCLDQPEKYHAEYRQLPESKELDFGLWYPSQGTSVFASQVSREAEPPAITRELKLSDIMVTAPGRVEDVVASALAYGYANGARDAALQTLKPWPGALEAIQVHVAR